jgi:hypothetical protein
VIGVFAIIFGVMMLIFAWRLRGLRDTSQTSGGRAQAAGPA